MMKKNRFNRVLSFAVAVMMAIAVLPSVAFAEDGETVSPLVDIDFTVDTQLSGSGNPVSNITSTKYTVVAEESTKTSGSRIYKDAKSNLYMLQVDTEKKTYFAPTTNASNAPETQFTIKVKMPEGFKSGFYDLSFRGQYWYPNSDMYIFAGGRYIGDYDVKGNYAEIRPGDEKVYKSVYLTPDADNNIKIMFAVKALGYGAAAGTGTYSSGRIALNSLKIYESAESETAEKIELNMGREKFYMSDNASFDGTYQVNGTAVVPNLKIIEKYSIDFDKSTATYPQRCYSTLLQIQLRDTSFQRWPASKSRSLFYVINTAVPKSGYYTVAMQGYKGYGGSDFAIYVNGEFAGEYSSWDGKTTSGSGTNLDAAPEVKNTIYIPRGDAEISFRTRKAHYTTPNLYPHKFILTPASAPEISEIENYAVVSGTETAITPELLSQIELGSEVSVVSRVKMTDGSYRHFGYTDSGALPTEDDVVSVKSSNPNVVEVSDVVCVEAATSTDATKTQVIDPTATKYKITAKNGGTADITVTAIVDGKTKTSTTTIDVPFADGSEVIEDEKVSFSALSETGGSVTPSGVREVKLGDTVTVEATANDGYEFAYWRNAAGVWLSNNAKETFTVNTNTAVVAVYDKIAKEETSDVSLRFYNGNGELLESKTVAKGTSFGDAKIADPTLVGAIFKGWNLKDSAIINEISRAVALYDDDVTTKYSVTVGGNVVTSGMYGDEVTVTGGDSFVCWKLGDNIVSYDKKYSFLLWGNIALTEVTEGESLIAPTVGIDKQGNNYFITYNVPENGYTFIEAGIVFGTSENISINSTDGSKAIAKKRTGHFTAKPAKAEHNVARGYVMFKDASGNVRVIYAD